MNNKEINSRGLRVSPILERGSISCQNFFKLSANAQLILSRRISKPIDPKLKVVEPIVQPKYSSKTIEFMWKNPDRGKKRSKVSKERSYFTQPKE